MIVAIHQPNYLPWLGYLQKIAAADAFIFLDNVQFSKNSVTNRVRILDGSRQHWLTVPVSVKLGDPINVVRPAREDWAERHLSTLRNFYASAPAFRDVWPDVEDLYAGLPDDNLAIINIHIVLDLAKRLELETRFLRASELGCGKTIGDDRIIELVKIVAPSGTYLSGQGGAKYQNEAKFHAANLKLRYADFDHPTYNQGGDEFVPGLSVIDAAFRLGWRGTRALVCRGTAP